MNRLHLKSHRLERINIGAGLVRVTCRHCEYTALLDAPEAQQRPKPDTMPEWMLAASERFTALTSA